MKWIQLIEAVSPEDGKTPTKWRVRLIRPGVSRNGNDYSKELLAKSVSLFEGVRALARSDEDHGRNTNKRVKDLAGWFSEAKVAADGSIEATFNISEAAQWLQIMISDAWNQDKKDLVGFSIVADAAVAIKRTARGLVRAVRELKKIHFVDVIVNPSAGGEVVGLAESENLAAWRQIMNLEKLLKLIEAHAPEEYKKLDLKNIDEDKVLELVESIMAGDNKPEVKPEGEGNTKPKPETKPTTEATDQTQNDLVNLTKEDLQKMIAEGVAGATKTVLDKSSRDNAEFMFNRMFAESVLSEDSKERVLKVVQATVAPATETQILEAINAEVKYLGKHTSFQGPGSTMGVPVIESITDGHDRWNAAMLGLFTRESEPINPNKPDGPKQIPYGSLREAYVDLTGDKDVTGRVSEATRVLAETTIDSTTFAAALGDHMHKAMQRAYHRAPFDQWKAIADAGNAKDFRTNYRPQIGGFGDLDSVAQGADYVDFGTIPDDFAPSFVIGKKGNLQPITLEMIANDDVSTVRRMPGAIGRAAMRTLNGDVWNPIITNANVSWESVALCAAAHGNNITTSALSPAAVTAGRVAMMKQTEPQSGERLNIGPSYLGVSVDQEQQAFEMCHSDKKPLLDTNTTSGGASDNPAKPNFFKSFNLAPLVIPHWVDTNNWLLLGNKMDMPMVEVGFFGGKEEPELFIQDMPNVGSMFNADKLTYKIRFIYGIVILDYRGFYYGNVA